MIRARHCRTCTPPRSPHLSTTPLRRPRWRPSQRGETVAMHASPLSLRYAARRLATDCEERGKRDRSRRALNVLVAGLGILVTAPLWILIAVAVKLSSPGPVVFAQSRVGLDRRYRPAPAAVNRERARDRGGRVFTIYKFRTMRTDGGHTSQVWASKDDPRITPVGRFLRATRLDELPQFINVLKGDMNIVGPRPEQPTIFEELNGELGNRYRDRQQVLPGITGLAQVTLGYDIDLDGVRRKIGKDLEYIRRRSTSEDLLIMAKTVPVMVFRKVWM
jgi:lipopolysaccharide/colanic/teichoic acid biosynthesis glycosyltransferase